eukprot:scpid92301/ scgid28354/ Protein Churchill
MCRECVHEFCKDRGTTCLETGVYYINLKGCVNCSTRGELAKAECKQEEDEDGAEEISFEHRCSKCDHVVAKHTYSFSVDDGYQEYSMQCGLCGTGSDSRSVLPDDPHRG